MATLPTGTVTLLFTDIEGSTRLLPQLGERYTDVLGEHHALLRAAFQAHGGREVDTQGDAFFVAFPRAREAVEAAIAAQRAVAAHPWPEGLAVRVRMALHTGEPTLAAGSYVGLDVHRAARLCAAGHGGQALLSEATRALVAHDLPAGVTLRDLGEQQLKDLPRPERIWQLVIPDLRADFPALRVRDARPTNLPQQPTSLIGRERDVDAVLELIGRADVRLVTLTGPGGTGKTRLGLQVATHVLDRLADGAFFVALAPIRDPDLVASAMAQTLGVRETSGRLMRESLTEHLRGRQTLLLLDNFEQVMRGTIAWSYELLDANEQTLFRRLAIYVGGWTLEAAEAVATAAGDLTGDVLEGVASLIDKSVVRPQATSGAEPRFGMLETIREYGLECLTASGEGTAISRAHAAWFLGLAEEAEAQFRGPEEGCWLSRLEGEHDNLRTALAWAVQSGEAELALRTAGALADYWQIHGHWSEGRRWLDEALAVAESLGRTTTRAKALYGTGMLARYQGDHAAARRALQESAALYRELGDARGIARAMMFMGLTSLDQGDRAAARVHCEEALPLAQAAGDRLCLAVVPSVLAVVAAAEGDYERAQALWQDIVVAFREIGSKHGIAESLNSQGDVARSQGDYARAQALYEEALTLSREVGSKGTVASICHNLGHVAHHQGDRRRAAALFQESLMLFRELGDPRGIAEALAGLGGVIGEEGQPEQAARLFGAVDATLEALGTTMWHSNLTDYQRHLMAVRASLSEAAFAAAQAKGRSMPLEQVLDAALTG